MPIHSALLIYSLIYYNIGYAILGLIFGYMIMVLSQEVGGHRYFSHYSFNVNKLTERIIFGSMIVAGNGSPLDWRSSHLDHHSYSDTDRDPTSPKRFGVFGILSNYWKFKYQPQQTALRSMIWVNKNNPEWITYHNLYFRLVLVYQLSIIALFGFEWFIVLVSIPVLISNIYLNLISAYAHKHRYRTGDETHCARDNQILNLFSPGAGQHNEHHCYPGQYRSEQFDLAGMVIERIRC